MGMRDRIKNLVEQNNDDMSDSEIDNSDHEVYITYSTKDMNIALGVCNALEDNDIKCWIAPRNIRSGMPYKDEISDAIKSTKMIVLVYSSYSQESKYVNNEIKMAFSRNKSIIAFNIDGSMPRADMEFYLKSQKFLPAYPNPEEHIDKLVKTVSSFLYGNPEQDMQPETEPFPPYHGEDKYIFISHVDEDSELVYPDIRKFQDLGCNVWYDDSSTNEKNNRITRLKECDLFVVFVTNNSMSSINVQKEIKYAVKYNKNMIPIYLEDFDEIEMEDDIDFELSVIQGILKITLTDEEYVFKFTEALQRFGFDF